MEQQIFISHTKNDKTTCDAFDNIVARVGIKAFRSEFENISSPAWKSIKNEINRSKALFFLIGKELVNNQHTKQDGWEHTQNWIAYEIGVACQKGIDVWAICDDVEINFPMPYVNNYLPNVKLDDPNVFNFLKGILEAYKTVPSLPATTIIQTGLFSPQMINDVFMQCPNCKIEYNLRKIISPGEHVRCPQCLVYLQFDKGFPVTK